MYRTKIHGATMASAGTIVDHSCLIHSCIIYANMQCILSWSIKIHNEIFFILNSWKHFCIGPIFSLVSWISGERKNFTFVLSCCISFMLRQIFSSGTGLKILEQLFWRPALENSCGCTYLNYKYNVGFVVSHAREINVPHNEKSCLWGFKLGKN